MKHKSLMCKLVLVCSLIMSAANAYADLGGVYQAELPSGSGMGRVITLLLQPDNSFAFIEKYLGREPAAGFISAGQWALQANELSLQLSWRDGEASTGELRFAIEQDRLRYLGSDYGEAGLSLAKP